MKAPDFWSPGKGGLAASLLAPLGQLYGLATARRLARGPGWKAPVPVICVGNLIAGGAGKTPTAIALAGLLQRQGLVPHFLSRGYQGKIVRPVRVSPARHTSEDVGDEPLLLAEVAPTWVCKEREISAREAVNAGATALIMDDGFQNPGLAKDFSLVVLDGGFGFGNGKLIPAGPLRESVKTGLARAQAVLVVGSDTVNCRDQVPDALPVLDGRIVPGPDAKSLVGQKVFAFAGIGRPQKFHSTLKSCGAEVVGTEDFADHHPYNTAEIQHILTRAESLGARPITTAKDILRVPAALRNDLDVLTIRLEWDEELVLNLLNPILFT